MKLSHRTQTVAFDSKEKQLNPIDKLKLYLKVRFEGYRVRGFKDIPLVSIYGCMYVYNDILAERPSEFIDENVKDVLEACGIEVVSEGIGWRVVYDKKEVV